MIHVLAPGRLAVRAAVPRQECPGPAPGRPAAPSRDGAAGDIHPYDDGNARAAFLSRHIGGQTGGSPP
ncbi:hypothetical protein [Kitasatospora purpeofusca]|uniref:hypothetical protein n=1 Tax=Kitasatospora purpeofusca TaxID=67352 RepID=UPI0036D3989F